MDTVLAGDLEINEYSSKSKEQIDRRKQFLAEIRNQIYSKRHNATLPDVRFYSVFLITQ